MRQPEEIDAYFICATPRSGSTLLCGLLKSTGVAGRPESYFRQPDEQMWAERWGLERASDGSVDYRDYVRAAVAAGTTSNGVFGARIMWGATDQLVARLRNDPVDDQRTDAEVLEDAFGPTRFVYLWREDALAQAVSWARAEQSGFWHPRDGSISERSPSYDFAVIDALVKTVAEHNASWGDWFARHAIQPHVVRYEDLAADMVATTAGVLHSLGLTVPSSRNITARDERQADDLNAEWINRYRAEQDPSA